MRLKTGPFRLPEVRSVDPAADDAARATRSIDWIGLLPASPSATCTPRAKTWPRSARLGFRKLVDSGMVLLNDDFGTI